MPFVSASSLPANDGTGRTIREANEQDLHHEIPVGTLVEIVCRNAHQDLRLRVLAHTRDCDGTPLYSLGWSQTQHERIRFGAESLRVVDDHGA